MNQTIDIQTEFTPNPNSLKFNLSRELIQKGSFFFDTKQSAKEVSDLATRLFEIPRVESILIGQNFVTISRDPSLSSWGSLIEPVSKMIREYVSSGAPIINLQAASRLKKEPASDIEKKIIQVLDTYVRPAIARDGGDITFHGFKDGVVTLHLQGACTTCPSSVATLKAGVERMLCEFVPEVKEVVQVN